MPFPKEAAKKAVKKASKKKLKGGKDKKLFNSAAKALLGASKKGFSKVPGRAETPGDSESNDKTLILASPGEGIVPRSQMMNPMIRKIFESLPKMAEGGEVPDPMNEFLDKFETEDEYAKRSMQESKKYKKAKKGDPGVIDVGFDDEGNAKMPPPKMACGGMVPRMAEGGEVPQQEPGLIAAIKNWLSSQRGDAGASKQVAEEMNKKLPRAVSGRDAVERKRAQYKQIDELER